MSKILLKLFVTGSTPSSQRAVVNLQRICDDRMRGVFEIHIIDVLEHPSEAEELRILATPMLIRESPLPPRRVIGDLSDMEKVFEALELHHCRAITPAQQRRANGG